MLKVCSVTFACILTLATAAVAADTQRVAPSASPAGIIIIGGIQGESRTKPGGIDAKSISAIECSAPAPAGAQPSTHAVTSPRDAATGMATGKRMHKPITITKELDKSSPLLAKAVAAGTPIPKAVIEQGGATYELEGVLIGLLKTGGGNRPMETFTLNFAKCTRR
jgi:type VI protein secretion system component Hcp